MQTSKKPSVVSASGAIMKPPPMRRPFMIETINAVERDFRAQFPATAWLFFEPDVED